MTDNWTWMRTFFYRSEEDIERDHRNRERELTLLTEGKKVRTLIENFKLPYLENYMAENKKDSLDKEEKSAIFQSERWRLLIRYPSLIELAADIKSQGYEISYPGLTVKRKGRG